MNKNKYLLLIILAISLLSIAGLTIYMLFLRDNKEIDYTKDNSVNDGKYCQIVRVKENIDRTIPCDERRGSLKDRKNSFLVTFHLYTPSDWSYKNFQTFEIDTNTEEIVSGIMPN